MKRYYSLTAAACLILFAVYIFFSSYAITSTANAALGPAFMPKMVGVILFVLGCMNLVSEIKQLESAALKEKNEGNGELIPETKKDVKGYIAEHIDYISALLLLVYVFAIKPLGFLIASCIYMFAHMLLLTVNVKRNYIRLILLAVIAPSIIYFGFVKFFYLMLPPGILG